MSGGADFDDAMKALAAGAGPASEAAREASAAMVDLARAIAEAMGAWLQVVRDAVGVVHGFGLFPRPVRRSKTLRIGPTAYHWARARAECKRQGWTQPETVEMWAWHYRRQGMAGRVIP